MKTVIKMISSGLYAGYSPIAPGTIGSMWGVLIYLQLKDFPIIYAVVTVLLFVIGFLICGRAEKVFDKKDSPRIVIDEIASMCLVYFFIRPSFFMVASGFVIFRIFDIIKPPPARRLEKFAGSHGVMLDDIVAAVYTVAVLWILSFIVPEGILRAGCR